MIYPMYVGYVPAVVAMWQEEAAGSGGDQDLINGVNGILKIQEVMDEMGLFDLEWALCKKASNHHANLPLEMYSFTL